MPGEQLSCVIIDKLPFAVPNDPVVNARIESIRNDGRQSVLRLPDSAGGDRAEAGIRAADPQPVPTAACWSLLDNRITKTALRAGVFRQPAGLRIHHPNCDDVEKFFDV